jgi:acyl-CoA-binding protein
MNMNSAFDQVVILLRETPVSTPVKDRLRLYVLFKQVTEGTCSGNESPSMLRITEYSKYKAWISCQDLSKDQAMKEYVLLAASQKNLLGSKCTEVWKKYNDAAAGEM